MLASSYHDTLAHAHPLDSTHSFSRCWGFLTPTFGLAFVHATPFARYTHSLSYRHFILYKTLVSGIPCPHSLYHLLVQAAHSLRSHSFGRLAESSARLQTVHSLVCSPFVPSNLGGKAPPFISCHSFIILGILLSRYRLLFFCNSVRIRPTLFPDTRFDTWLTATTFS
jgi:hypothetical protein